MKKVYCVSYDLNKSGKDYKGLIEELKKSTLWWHYLDSFWLISTSETAVQLFDRIKSHIDDDDSVIVIRVTNDYTGWLPQKAWDWIKENVN